MKVCVLSGSSFEKNYASYHLMRDLMENLVEQGHEVCLIQKCFEKPGCLPPELQNKAGITVSDIRCSQRDKKNLIKRMLTDMKYYLDTASSIRKFKDCDVFFLQSNNVPWLPIGLIRMLAHKPILYNVQDIFPQNAVYSGMLSEQSIISKALFCLQKWALRHGSAIVTISEDMKETLVEAGAEAQNVSVAYNWANQVHGSMDPIEKPNDGKYHVVYAGNIGRMQNVEVVIRAAAQLKDYPQIQFDIYGNGALKEKCVALSQELKTSNIRFFDPVPSEQAHFLYENADMNIVPLAENIIKTALPSKTAVCVSCGKPSIFTVGKDSTFSKTVSGNAGVAVIESNDAQGLARIVLESFCTPAQKVETSKLKEMFGEKNIRTYVDVLQNLSE